MCGIAGILNINANKIDSIKSLLFHRGPDEQSSYRYKNLNLIHTRLSIQDFHNGSQPIEIGNYVIIFNGEIYNHMQLRNKISNYSFKTQSDTETFLALYIDYGANAFSMCDGMFAFAILDKNKNKLIMGRDRAGKKPLYYYKEKKTFAFASELNAIKACDEEIQINEDEIYSYLRNGFFCLNKTPFTNVYEVPPGVILTISLETLSIQEDCFFEILDFYKKDKINNFNYALKLVEKNLKRSVEDRLISSDFEVGAFLSGGIDSSLIVAMASQYVDKLKTFTVKFDGAFDESLLAKLTANKYGTDHTEIEISMNLRDDIESILNNYGEPFMDSSAVPSYYISKEAKKHVSVILNGDGADELFGGYRRYVPVANNWLNVSNYFSKLTSILPKSTRKDSYYNYFYRLLKLSNKKGLDFYNTATNDIFEDIYEFSSTNSFESMDLFIHELQSEKISDLSKMLIMDFKFLLPSDLLKKNGHCNNV